MIYRVKFFRNKNKKSSKLGYEGKVVALIEQIDESMVFITIKPKLVNMELNNNELVFTYTLRNEKIILCKYKVISEIEDTYIFNLTYKQFEYITANLEYSIAIINNKSVLINNKIMCKILKYTRYVTQGKE